MICTNFGNRNVYLFLYKILELFLISNGKDDEGMTAKVKRT